MGGRRKAANPAGKGKTGWERDQFSVRLTELRRDCLRLISKDMPAGSTPNDAFDRALEMALSKAVAEPAGSQDVLARLGDLEELVAEMARKGEAEAAAQRAVAAQTLEQARSIASLISAVASMPAPGRGVDDDDGDGDGDGGFDISNAVGAERTASLRSWLDARGRGRQALECLGRWRAMSRLTDRLVAIDFELAEPGQAGERSLVRIEPVDAASPLAKVDQVSAVSLSCRRIPGAGWMVAARGFNQDRSLGPAICEFRV